VASRSNARRVVTFNDSSGVIVSTPDASDQIATVLPPASAIGRKMPFRRDDPWCSPTNGAAKPSRARADQTVRASIAAAAHAVSVASS
jgi:hypothetical protein